VASREGGAKFKILVFPIGGKVSNESPSTLKVTMKPPTTSALNVAKEAVVASNHADTPRLDITNIEIDIKFTVKKDGEAASCGSQ
jgi:hypothetical protein